MKTSKHDTFKELYEARHEPENLRPIAEVYWRTLLIVALAAVALVILFGIWEFSSVLSTVTAANTDGAGQQKPAIDRAQLERALNAFSERKANFEMSKGLVPVVTDPMK